MKILLFSDAFPPFQSSASIQLKDLTDQFLKDGHDVTVFTTSSEDHADNFLELNKDLRIFRIKNPQTKNINFIRRAFSELLIPITSIISFYKSPCSTEAFDGIIWYSPSIFFGIPIYLIKKKIGCKSYLILRDIFPEWAMDIGHMNKGIIYYFFRFFENIQYKAADTIGVQSISNINYFKKNYPNELAKVEVLNNWLSEMEYKKSTIDINNTSLSGRYIVIYAGNMGSAQKLENIANLAIELKDNSEIGFIFLGDGDAKGSLQKIIKAKKCKNVLFFDSIPHSELSCLYKQCNLGIISLDPKHKTYNIPGKLISYLINGLSIFALVNEGNDLITINNDYNIGVVSTDADSKYLKNIFTKYYKINKYDEESSERSKKVALELFSSSSASNQILSNF
tara:strand:- start:149 stop:1333 length:1185 start_codon:yes stop_codon:yes gene_type:complete